MECLNKLSEDWNGITEIVLYGFGRECRRFIDKLILDFKIPFIIDNDPAKKNTKYKGIPIIAWEEAEKCLGNRKIVVTTKFRQYHKIAEQLSNAGLMLNRDYISIKHFVPEWYWKNKKLCCLYTIDMVISAKCNYRCKNCNMFMPYYKNSITYTFDELKKNVDSLFGVIDYVGYIALLGGESLLCTCPVEFIEYIATAYAGRFGTMTFHSNGSIIPSVELLQTIKKYDLTYLVSDYGEAAPDRKNIETVAKLLEEYQIKNDIIKDLLWRDVGFPETPNHFEGGELEYHLQSCSSDWRAVNDGKFYYCNLAWSAEKAGLFELKKSDYLEMEELAALGDSGKEKLLRFSEGEIEGGYMSFCKVCGGCGSDNENFVVPGLQLRA